jgi:uncharacterized membrane protein YcfT
MLQRLNWVDYAKGFIILWMVLYQCVTRVGYTHPHEGLLYHIAEFGSPVRMQTLFMISGLLFASSLHMAWGDFFKTRLASLLYLFILWSFIAVILKTAGHFRDIPYDFLHALFVKPLGSVWFIIILPLYMLLTRLCRNVPPLLMFALGVGLEFAHIGPYSVYTDNFAQYYIYFLIGVYGKSLIHYLTAWFAQRPFIALAYVLCFGLINGLMVSNGLFMARGYGLLLCLGALVAMIAFSLLLTRLKFLRFLQFIGKNSLVFYVGYTPFMLIVSLFIKTRVQDASLYTAILWCICMAGSYSLWLISQKFKLHWLYGLPKWLSPSRQQQRVF